MSIRRAEAADADGVLAIIMPIIREGRTYALDPGMSEVEALRSWMGDDRETLVLTDDGVTLGTYYLRPNQAAGGRHVCNCGYATRADATGLGIARGMCEHSLDEARARGYRAMQFNFVVASNERAVRLWRSLGFVIVGTLPGAFVDPAVGNVDAYVMHRTVRRAHRLARARSRTRFVVARNLRASISSAKAGEVWRRLG